MIETITVRLARPEDEEQIQAVDARVTPYRPEHKAEVEAMYQRAEKLEEIKDRWVPLPILPTGSERTKPGRLAFWVAAVACEQNGEKIVGVGGIGHLDPRILPPNMPYFQQLKQRHDFLELQHLRIDPDFQGRGVGTRLCQTILEWAREQGNQMVLINTTVPQIPARNLYHKLGFQETVRTFIGQFEMVWMEKQI